MAEETFEKPAKLPVWSTVIQSFVLTLKNLGWFVKMAWVWVIVFMAALAAIYWASWPNHQVATATGYFSWRGFLGTIPVSLLVGSSIAVAWHRRLLLGEDLASSTYLRLDRVVLKYFAWGALFTLFWLVPIAIPLIAIDQWATPTEAQLLTESPEAAVAEKPSGSVSGVTDSDPDSWMLNTPFFVAMFCVVFGAITIVSYVPTRLGLVLPALALGHQRFSFIESWHASSGNFWRLYLGTIVTIALPTLAVMMPMVVLELSEFSDTRLWYVFDNCLTEVLTLIIGMTGITFLSLAYRHFTGDPSSASKIEAGQAFST
jgi:hypothetical protein